MKFQNPSMHSSEVMLWIKKHNIQTDRHTHIQTSQKQYATPISSKLGGIIKGVPNRKVSISERELSRILRRKELIWLLNCLPLQNWLHSLVRGDNEFVCLFFFCFKIFKLLYFFLYFHVTLFLFH